MTQPRRLSKSMLCFAWHWSPVRISWLTGSVSGGPRPTCSWPWRIGIQIFSYSTNPTHSKMIRRSAKSGTLLGVGMAVPLPLFNRNQGNIQRARLNVTQTQAELLALEDKVVYEVRQAERQYTVTRVAIARIEHSLLPKARKEHDRITNLYLAGKADELRFLPRRGITTRSVPEPRCTRPASPRHAQAQYGCG